MLGSSLTSILPSFMAFSYTYCAEYSLFFQLSYHIRGFPKDKTGRRPIGRVRHKVSTGHRGVIIAGDWPRDKTRSKSTLYLKNQAKIKGDPAWHEYEQMEDR